MQCSGLCTTLDSNILCEPTLPQGNPIECCLLIFVGNMIQSKSCHMFYPQHQDVMHTGQCCPLLTKQSSKQKAQHNKTQAEPVINSSTIKCNNIATI